MNGTLFGAVRGFSPLTLKMLKCFTGSGVGEVFAYLCLALEAMSCTWDVAFPGLAIWDLLVVVAALGVVGEVDKLPQSFCPVPP